MNRSTDPGSNPATFPTASRPAAPPGDGSFGGKLKPLSIADVLEFLRVLGRRGHLVVRDGEREVQITVREGRVLSASSKDERGDLGAFLLARGEIRSDQHEALARRSGEGEKPARALIELGILTPKGVWEALRRQARAIVLELFEWQQGEFRFQSDSDAAGSAMEVDLPILDLLADGIRSVKNTTLFQQRMPSESSVFEAIPAAERKFSIPLEPHERYVLGLLDGRRNLGGVLGQSELGRAETLRVVFLLFSMGHLKMKAMEPAAHPAPSVDPETARLIRRYNEMFAFLHRYLVREVGPIGEAVLDRYFEEQKRAQPDLLVEERIGRDGTLDEAILIRNLASIGNGGRMEILVDGLNELLYAELLAVRRTLGPTHEGRAVQGLRELGLQPITQVGPEGTDNPGG
jgi:hypothetical protein